jgi:Fe-S oxidoreductase
MQKCCGKPCLAAGKAELFQKRRGCLVEEIRYCNVDEVIVACPSCMKVLGECKGFKTTSLWELFPRIGLPKELVGKAKDSDVLFSVHDSFQARDRRGIHDGVRWLLATLGYALAEPARTREDTRCCGFGGTVAPVNPGVAKRAMNRRVEDFPTDKIVTYCAACRQSLLSGGKQAWHMLDLVWGDVVYADTPPPENTFSRTLKAWSNRYRSRQLIKAVMK